MDIEEITSEKDLRNLTFSDVFYSLYDAIDRKHACAELIGQIDPTAPQIIADARKKALELDVLIEDLKIHEALCRNWDGASRFSPVRSIVEAVERTYSNRKTGAFQAVAQIRQDPRFRMAELLGDATTISSLHRTLEAYTRDPGLREVYREFLEKIDLSPQDAVNQITSHPFATYFCADETRCTQLLQTIRQQQLDALAFALTDRTIKGIYVISLLSTDQDLIVYTGNTFHASFQTVDAYTGLIYTAEYYDVAAQHYEKTSKACEDEAANYSCRLFAFSNEDHRACRERLQAEAKAIKRKREEQEEAERKKKDYDKAKRILELNNSTASHLSKAKELLKGLGEYEDAPLLLERATERHTEAERHEQLQAELYRKARGLMPRMGWYGDIDPLEIREAYETPHLPKPDTTCTTGWSVLHCDEEGRCVYLWTQDCIAESENNPSKIAKELDMALFGTLPLEVRIRAKKWTSLNGINDPELRLFVPTTDMQTEWELSDGWPSCGSIDPKLSHENRYGERRISYHVFERAQNQFCSSDGDEQRRSAFIRPVICLDFSLTDEELERRQTEEKQRDAYLKAFGYCEAGSWDLAQEEFCKLGTYETSERMARVCRYHSLNNKAMQCEDKTRFFLFEDAEKTYRNAAKIYLEAEAAEEDADFNSFGGRLARKDSDRCLSLAATCHASLLLQRIAELRLKKERLVNSLKTTPLERKLADVNHSIQEKEKQFDNLSLLNISGRRELKREIGTLTLQAESLYQQAQDERADTERETANKIEALSKKHAPLLTELRSCIKKGSSVFFGMKSRDDKRAAWPTWHVGKITGRTLLLVADSTLVVKRPYHSQAVERISWRQCGLRAWLNTTFFDETFTKYEQALISRQRKSSSDDLVFIPSAKEWNALDPAVRNASKGFHHDIWLRFQAKSPVIIAREQNQPSHCSTSKSKVAQCLIDDGLSKNVTEKSGVLPCIIIDLSL